MESPHETPFDSIESAHEYIDLLVHSVGDVRVDVDAEIARAEAEGAERRKHALLLVAYKLVKLQSHVTVSRRILNDLRTLRRLLLEERKQPAEDQPPAGS
jgi:hypothetical protein